MLGSMFPSLFGGNEKGNASLDVGNKPENLNGSDKADFTTATQLSAMPTPVSVNAAARLAGNLEAQTVLLKEESAQKLEAQKASLANLEVRVNHAKQSMANTQQFQKKMSRHGKNILEHNIGKEATVQNFESYESRFNGVTIDI